MIGRPRFHHGWTIVGVAIVTMIQVYGIRNSFAVFFPRILEEFDWDRGSTAAVLSLNLLIYGGLAPIAGTLGDMWKPRTVMTMGIVMLGVATACCAVANELWQFYLLFGVLAPVGSAFSGWPLFGPALANWFTGGRGLVMGIGQMGGGLSFAYALLARIFISLLGWRRAFVVMGGTLMILVLPLHLLLFHYRPEDRGMKPFNTPSPSAAPETAAGAPPQGGPESAGRTLRQAMGSYQLWLLVLSNFLFWGIGCYTILAHQVKFAEDAGYGSTFAASIFALFGVSMMVGQPSGMVSDWIGREQTVTISSVLAVGAIVALISVKDTSHPELLYVYAACFGYGAGLYSPTLTAATADLFYGRHFGAIAGVLLTGMGIGGAIGPWLGGFLYDVYGSYTGAFALSMVAIALACACFWGAAPRSAGRLRTRPRVGTLGDAATGPAPRPGGEGETLPEGSTF